VIVGAANALGLVGAAYRIDTQDKTHLGLNTKPDILEQVPTRKVLRSPEPELKYLRACARMEKKRTALLGISVSSK
jgi:hypothetical protein